MINCSHPHPDYSFNNVSSFKFCNPGSSSSRPEKQSWAAENLYQSLVSQSVMTFSMSNICLILSVHGISSPNIELKFETYGEGCSMQFPIYASLSLVYHQVQLLQKDLMNLLIEGDRTSGCLRLHSYIKGNLVVKIIPTRIFCERKNFCQSFCTSPSINFSQKLRYDFVNSKLLLASKFFVLSFGRNSFFSPL